MRFAMVREGASIFLERSRNLTEVLKVTASFLQGSPQRLSGVSRSMWVSENLMLSDVL